MGVDGIAVIPASIPSRNGSTVKIFHAVFHTALFFQIPTVVA
jgi:hypothetical protein